jgi:tripartite-type tricarboxylate transporter receptor subunit TctC
MDLVRGLAGGLAAAFICTAVAIGGAAADDWPAGPVIMVIPFGAGSGIDVLGRVLAPAMAEKLGQPIVVENVGGAGGMTGTAMSARTR